MNELLNFLTTLINQSKLNEVNEILRNRSSSQLALTMLYSTLFQTNKREEKKKPAGETHVTKLLFLNSKVLGFSIMFNKSKFELMKNPKFSYI